MSGVEPFEIGRRRDGAEKPAEDLVHIGRDLVMRSPARLFSAKVSATPRKAESVSLWSV